MEEVAYEIGRQMATAQERAILETIVLGETSPSQPLIHHERPATLEVFEEAPRYPIISSRGELTQHLTATPLVSAEQLNEAENMLNSYMVRPWNARRGICVGGPYDGMELTATGRSFTVKRMVEEHDIQVAENLSVSAINDIAALTYEWSDTHRHWKCKIDKAFFTWMENRSDR